MVDAVFMPAHAQTSPAATSPGTGTTGPIVQCNSQQEAGGDTPENRSVDLGVNSGSFVLDYQTFSIQDQVVVRYEGNTLFNTGCVGASGSETINFSGNSSVVTVRVVPNCSGNTTGTAWNWTLNCPNP